MSKARMSSVNEQQFVAKRCLPDGEKLLKYVGEGIKAARMKAEVSQEELADACSISVRSLRNLESGHKLGFKTFLSVAFALGIDLNKFFEEGP